MGSLVPGWERERLGVPPKELQDFQEPRYVKSTKKNKEGPPNLNRISCPPSIHTPSSPRSFRIADDSLDRTSPISSLSRPTLSRPSISNPSTPVSGSTKDQTLFLKLLKEKTNAHEELHWCDRMDSAVLNIHPDDPADLNAWRSGSFHLDDPAHGTHISEHHAPGGGARCD